MWITPYTLKSFKLTAAMFAAYLLVVGVVVYSTHEGQLPWGASWMIWCMLYWPYLAIFVISIWTTRPSFGRAVVTQCLCASVLVVLAVVSAMLGTHWLMFGIKIVGVSWFFLHIIIRRSDG